MKKPIKSLIFFNNLAEDIQIVNLYTDHVVTEYVCRETGAFVKNKLSKSASEAFLSIMTPLIFTYVGEL
jgi:hypothetical protein